MFPKKTLIMKNRFIYFLILAIVSGFTSCKEEIPDVPDPNNSTLVDYVSKIQHPSLLHTQADFDFVKQKIAAGAQPWTNAYEHLKSNKHSQSSWKANPVVKLARLDAGNWATIDRWEKEGIADDWYQGIHSNYTNLMYDAASAYALALRWKLSDDPQFAKAAVDILNAWASTCVGYIVNKQGAFIDPNEHLIAIQVHQIVNAAEILRGYSGWNPSDFEAFKKWVVKVFYKPASQFLQKGGQDCPLHYWMNWDYAQMTAILSIGILTEDNYKINEVFKYFKLGVGTGGIANSVPFVHQDPDSGELLGQGNESGRDQGHAVLCVSLMGVFSQMAKNIGEHVFTYDNARALAMCEYIAKYNLSTAEKNNNFLYEVPFTHYTNCKYDHPQISSIGRGEVRPAWELVVRLAQDYGKSSIYAQKWVDLMRQSATRNFSDGGSGDYGSSSGGYDQLGWGTLMMSKK